MTHPDLFALLRGELTNADATAAGTHLADCDACRTELAELAVGNALLVRAARTVAGGVATPAPMPALPPLQRRPARRT
ncbi:zf-HC2 domain-containing protein, partial [Bradyrhizobium sp. NBAIM08]|uniref:zf-HC2 domain-containing protein n=1 Tax=Bradyrhizobium sp. NBAIM08 TaxID=2793815 RepID=UPI001CD2088E